MQKEHSYRVIKLKKVDSTNLWAKSAFQAKAISGNAVIVADTQLAGRGQMRTKWHDEPGQNLLCTLVFEPQKLKISSFFRLNEAVSLALIDVLKDQVSAKVKWPNDILVNSKKLAGILIETSMQADEIKTAFIGIGINVNQMSFDASLKASSIAAETGLKINLKKLLQDVLLALDFRLNQIDQPQLLQIAYKKELMGTDAFLSYNDKNGDFKAKIVKIEEDGRLVLQAENEISYRYYQFKEVKLLGD